MQTRICLYLAWLHVLDKSARWSLGIYDDNGTADRSMRAVSAETNSNKLMTKNDSLPTAFHNNSALFWTDHDSLMKTRQMKNIAVNKLYPNLDEFR